MKKNKKNLTDTQRKNKNIIEYFIKMIILFFAIELVIIQFPSLFAYLATNFKYGEALIAEIFYAFIVLIITTPFLPFFGHTQKLHTNLCVKYFVLIIPL